MIDRRTKNSIRKSTRSYDIAYSRFLEQKVVGWQQLRPVPDVFVLKRIKTILLLGDMIAGSDFAYCYGKSSVCPSVWSVTLRYRDHMGWNSSKIISLFVSLRCSFSAVRPQRHGSSAREITPQNFHWNLYSLPPNDPQSSWAGPGATSPAKSGPCSIL